MELKKDIGLLAKFFPIKGRVLEYIRIGVNDIVQRQFHPVEWDFSGRHGVIQ